jgi:SAM-dependent methyltransferase
MTSVSYRNFTGTGAENYERYFVPAIATPVSAALLRTAALRPCERVLDVACGTGLVTRLAAEAVGPAGSVTGVDVSPDMIQVARSVPRPAGAAIDWRTGDATSLEVEDGAYDVVLCQLGLMFMPDRLAAVAQMRRALAAGGRLVVNTPGAIQPVFEAMERAIVEHIGPDLGMFVTAVFSMHDPDGVAGLLRDAGLDGVAAAVSPATLHLDPPAAFLWQYINLTPMGPVVGQAPEAAREAMERQFVEDCEPYVAGGRTVVEQPMVVASGRVPAG